MSSTKFIMQRVLRTNLGSPARRSLSTTTRLSNEPKTTNSPARNYNASASAGHTGKTTSQHVTNSKDELDIHSAASAQGQRDRQSGDPSVSAATSQRDPGGSNKKAAQTTKAPGPVIGMQDERGGKGDT